MNEDGDTRGSRRYVALDIHKKYCVIAGVDRDGRVLLQPVRVEHADLEGWLMKNLRSTDQVGIESTTNAWHVYDLLAPLVERVVVANPIRVKQIAQAHERRTDNEARRANRRVVAVSGIHAANLGLAISLL